LRAAVVGHYGDYWFDSNWLVRVRIPTQALLTANTFVQTKSIFTTKKKESQMNNKETLEEICVLIEAIVSKIRLISQSDTDQSSTKPTVKTDSYGTKEWWLDGELHRTDGPAVEYPNGTKQWCLNGELHRTDGPAVDDADGTKEWWLNGKFHRTDGPAVEDADGTKEWWLNGKLHRTDGPAIEPADGTKMWCLNGKLLSESEFNERMS